MTIPHVHFSPLPSSTAAYILSPGKHSTSSAVAVPERTFGVPGLELLMTSVPGLRHSSGVDAPICRAVERPRSERHGVCSPPCLTDIRSLRSKPVLSGSQGNPEQFMKVPQVASRGGRTLLTLCAHASSTQRSPGLGGDHSGGPVVGFHARHEKRLSLSRQSSQGEWDAWDLDLSSRTQLSSLSTSSISVSTHRARHPPKRTVAAITRSSRR